MKKNKKIDISRFSQKNRSDIPEEFTWNEKDIYLNISEWEKDKKQAIKSFKEINVKKANWTKSAKRMLEMFKLIYGLKMKIGSLYTYVHLYYDTDMANNKYTEMDGEINALSVEFKSQISFVQSDIILIDKKKFFKFYESEPRLRIYKRKIDSILKLKKHVLDEEKEKLVSMTGLFSEGGEKASGILNNIEIPTPEVQLSNQKKIKLDTATFVQYRGTKNKNDRKIVMKAFLENQQKFENTLAALLDSEIQKRLFFTKTYNFKNSLDAALVPNDIDRGVYLNLIKSVKMNLKPLHRYLGLKEKLLNLKKLEYNDIYASVVPDADKKYSIDEAKKVVIKSLEVMGDDYLENLRKGFSEGWMDIYPNKGKRSGAYSNGSVYAVHPFVLMNFNGRYNEVSTLTHEFGHAMHSFYSNKKQAYPNANYPIFLAEIASTFNETLLVDYVLENEKDDRVRLYIIDKHLEGLRGTM